MSKFARPLGDSEYHMTLTEISIELNISYQRVQQILNRAIQKLRQFKK